MLRWFNNQIDSNAKLLAFVFVVITCLIGVRAYDQRSVHRDRVQTAALIAHSRTAQLRTCQRLQILRDQTNATMLTAYTIFHATERQENDLAKRDPENAVLHRELALAFRRSSRQLMVTGPTSCREAVDHADRYAAPAPEFIFKDGLRVKIAQKRAKAIQDKARRGEPLYKPGELKP